MAEPYNPNDPIQSGFLAILRQGETGHAGNAYSEGFGGVDLSHAAVGSNGFPIWQGNATYDTHAAGAYQIQPGTWQNLSSKLGLNFQNPSDQDAAAWTLAAETYAKKTGGSLEEALAAGDAGSIQQALAGQWPSVAKDDFSKLSENGGLSGAAANAGQDGLLGGIENFFQRSGLIILGGIVVIVALWQILSNTTGAPGPGDAAKAAAAAL